MNIFYIGSSGALSLIPFKRLLSSRHTISAAGVFNPVVLHGSIIALENAPLSLTAMQHNIPLIDLSQSLAAILQQCKQYQIDIILVSCYSKRVPNALLELVNHACFNMHPSLLPNYRGPEPIFWQMKHASELGVSWHQLTHDFDAGDIVQQQNVQPVEAASHVEISLQLAEIGAELMLMLLADVATGAVRKTRQNKEAASYYPYPQQADFVLDLQRTALQAYNFMCATQAFGFSYRCQLQNQCYFLAQALGYHNESELKTVKQQGNTLYIPFNKGVLIASYTDKMRL